VHPVLGDIEAEVVPAALGDARFDAPAGEPAAAGPFGVRNPSKRSIGANFRISLAERTATTSTPKAGTAWQFRKE
jgi:hypothetical protein